MSQPPIRIAPSINRHKLASLLVFFWTIVFFLLTFSTIITLHKTASWRAETAVKSEAFNAGRCMAFAYNKSEIENEKCKQYELCDSQSWDCRQLDEKLYDNTVNGYTTNTLIQLAFLYAIGTIFFFLAGRKGLSVLEALITGAIAGWRDFRKWMTN